MEAKHLLANLAILLCFFVVALSATDEDNNCVYTVYVRTGKIINGGTDSIISVAFYDEDGDGILIKNLEAWGGVMGEKHDYFERGNLDIFTGRGPCLRRPICAMELISDGSGPHHGWYCNYVEVTSTGPHIQCAQQTFTVEQWLALDTSPYELTAVRNNCPNHLRLDPAKLVPVQSSLASSSY